MAYETWLAREEWQLRRKQILNRDNHKCQGANCDGKSKRLEVHHVDYLSYELRPEEYPSDMLITLCSGCHRKEKLRFKHEESLLIALKHKKFLMPDIVSLTALIYSDKEFTNNLLHRLRELQNG
jgi:hypothetical protein